MHMDEVTNDELRVSADTYSIATLRHELIRVERVIERHVLIGDDTSYFLSRERILNDAITRLQSPGIVLGSEKTCACGQWPVSEYGELCPSCPSQTYFAIPTLYTIGDTFDDLDSALVEAAHRIQKTRDSNLQFNALVPEKLCVDERVKDNTGDRPVRRWTLSAQARGQGRRGHAA